jgi:hypothetical protein
MFTTDSTVLSDLAALLKYPNSGALLANAPYWTTIVSLAHQTAYNTIVRALLARGYLIAQILAWDEGPAFERQQALYQTLVQGAGLADSNATWTDKLNLAGPGGVLSTVLVYAGGVVQEPLGVAGQPATGPIQGACGPYPGLGYPSSYGYPGWDDRDEGGPW